MAPTTKGQNNASIFDGLEELHGSDTRPHQGSGAPHITQRSRHDNTYAITVCWDGDEAYRREETSRLGSALNQHYLAKCDQLTIVKGETTQATFEENLRRLACRARIGHNLLILIYAGGSDVIEGQFVLKSPAASEPPCVIKWDPLLQILTKQSSDVLVVFDCAYSMDGQTQPVSGDVEILAASEGTALVRTDSGHSLAHSLERALQAIEGASVSVSGLVDYLKTSSLVARPCHKIISQTRPTGLSLALPVGKVSHATERSGLLRLKLHASGGIEPSKVEINDGLQHTLSRDETVSNEPVIEADGTDIAFRAQESVVIDPDYWEQMVQNKPAVVSHVELELSQACEPGAQQPPSSAGIVNNLVDNLQFTNAIRKVLHNKYASVCVVPLMWENIERHLEQEEGLNEIREVFRNEYKYDVDEIYRIKSDRYATTALKAYINQKLDDNHGTDKLLITVYGGHGRNLKKEMTTAFRMKLFDTAAGRFSLDWSSVQSDLYQARCDTLTIMSCCYGGNAILEEVNGANETLSVVDRDTEALTSDRSFLRFLSKELKTVAQSGGANISSLYQALDHHNMPGVDAIKAPWRHRVPIDKSRIWLRPLPPAHSPRVENDVGTGNESFFVQFFLRDLEDIDLSHYNEFFKNWDVPPTIKAIQFHKKDQLRKASETH